MIYRTSGAHEEGGERAYAVSTLEFLGDSGGRVRALRLADAAGFDPVPGTEHELPCDLVLLAMGFTGAERPGLLTDLGVEFDARGNVSRDASYATSVPGVFAAGDMGRGQSLIVWAIAEGRSAAAAVDAYLGGAAELPKPIPPTARPLVLTNPEGTAIPVRQERLWRSAHDIERRRFARSWNPRASGASRLAPVPRGHGDHAR
jgi:glutamate synthase (NADPH/NADH) small chain